MTLLTPSSLNLIILRYYNYLNLSETPHQVLTSTKASQSHSSSCKADNVSVISSELSEILVLPKVSEPKRNEKWE